jgi:hypothetical protein
MAPGTAPTASHGATNSCPGALIREDVDAAFRVIVKAGGRGKGSGRWRELAAPDVPQRQYDLRIVDHYVDPLQAALAKLVDEDQLRELVLIASGLFKQSDPGELST